MEYVEGEPIDGYCDGRGLGARERLELFRAVCAAVQYAHQNLVVHRDLKPGNILVTADGTPKLLDFGIAKLLEPDVARRTRPPRRPSAGADARVREPGAAAGRAVTTASDVYSLGVLLYELLTGRPPASRTGQPGRRVVRGQEPPRPSDAAARATSRSLAPTADDGAPTAPMVAGATTRPPAAAERPDLASPGSCGATWT